MGSLVSAQIIELLLFAGIAFFLVSKLISILGTTNEGEANRTHGGSFFGEPTGMKDVTQVAPAIEILQKSDLDEIIVSENYPKVMQNLQVLSDKMPDFDLKKFVKGAKVAFEMILGSYTSKDKEVLSSLVDPRFLESFEGLAEKYGSCNANALNVKVSDIYMFGHTGFVKVLFTGKAATSNLGELNEEWVFTRNISQRGPNWFLSNIEVA